MTDGPPELWDIDRVCAYLDCSKHLVYRLTRERRIRYVRVGKELRFRAADVATWLEVESVPARTARHKPPRPRRGRPRDQDRAA
jgi:excisionase family DNA binding protein